MFANRYTALIDACSLVSVWRRNFLLSLAESELFRVRWSNKILQETEIALIKIFEKREIINSEIRAANSIRYMQEAFPEAMTEFTNYKYGLPDENDEHVLNAAIACQAQTIVTENIKDFPEDILKKFNIEAKKADNFIADTISLDERVSKDIIRNMRLRLKKPEMTPQEFIKSLEADGLIETANILLPIIDSI